MCVYEINYIQNGINLQTFGHVYLIMIQNSSAKN